MDPLALYCKSWRRDAARVRILARSIERFNTGALPFYVSCPDEDRPVFEEQLRGTPARLISDREITEKTDPTARIKVAGLPGRIAQQVIKAEFWRLRLAACCVTIDSDSCFIRPFSAADFLAAPGEPYTVMHEGRELLTWAARAGPPKIIRDFRRERETARALFNRSGRLYDFGPTPAIWDARVWRSLHERYAAPRGEGFADLIARFPSELLWYGEAFLHFGGFPLRPAEPLFKVFHYAGQFAESRKLGDTQGKLAENYLGIVSQSNWDYATDFEPRPRRSWRTCFLKRAPRKTGG